ncbi:disulfide bond formation protein DsbB [Avibacterium paragallinarum]|uniref:Disulfide bond formation protein B n=1 Tax=Avibacterium paragallinarum TaxID=728 RepID=A0A0F5EY15_AVIPA|nr:disulfide bond formation protein DsbB [Avibacterium paragallinarum]KAA6209068.1 disulfide bond formation protein DsbB [Avibacterium paragallinarum]KKB01260.1 disulfide bond formation protein DsbB [Avibacterium paragallinarum]MEE3607963.1 disulfide bond formation protein DsbB [Avibacterium paragallinarum]MEE3620954.1 disulfide bond formation protein DsbB [Avibacterium paragallinarum]MEE3667987.1 disulfide bond formation protein DsbB [Avibacterium paragallinarum]
MLKYFKQLSMNRGGWLLLLVSTLALESTALYFQHGMGLAPCVMCIYERVALVGLSFSALLGLLYPRALLLRLLALLGGLGSSVKGLLLAIKHVDYQLYPAPWNQCSYIAEFPQTLPLDRWVPAVFNPTGSCSEITWSFLGFSMAQWIVVIFAFYTLLLLVLLISQFKRVKQPRNIFK